MCKTQQQQQIRDNNSDNNVSSRSIMNLSSTFTIMHDVKIYEPLRHFNIWFNFDIKRIFSAPYEWVPNKTVHRISAVRVCLSASSNAMRSTAKHMQ